MSLGIGAVPSGSTIPACRNSENDRPTVKHSIHESMIQTETNHSIDLCVGFSRQHVPGSSSRSLVTTFLTDMLAHSLTLFKWLCVLLRYTEST